MNDSVGSSSILLFAIFLVSVLALEVILRHDEMVERKAKLLREAARTEPKNDVPHPNPDPAAVLALAKAVQEHDRKARQPIALDSSRRASLNSDTSLEPSAIARIKSRI